MNAQIPIQTITTRPNRRSKAARIGFIALAAARLVPVAVAANLSASAVASVTSPDCVHLIKTEEPTRGQIAEQVLDEFVWTDLKGDVEERLVTTLRFAYDEFDYEPVWNDHSVKQLRKAVVDHLPHGLDLAPVNLEYMDRLIEARTSDETREAAEADISLTAIFVRFAWQVNGGLSDEGEVVMMGRSELDQEEMNRAIAVAGGGNVEAAISMIESNR